MKVVIDAGHGIYTAGKRTPADEREWSFNNMVAASLAKELVKYGVSVLRVDDTTGKTDVPLRDRVTKANNWKADIYISIHHNALRGYWNNHTGTETYIHTNASVGSIKLANLVHKNLVGAMGLKDRGIKRSNFYVLKNTKMPSLLTEGGYMDSVIDIVRMRNDQVLKNAGVAISKAVLSYFGKSSNTVVQAVSNPIVKEIKEKTYVVQKGDTLYSIAKSKGIDVQKLIKINSHLDPQKLEIGQSICLDLISMIPTNLPPKKVVRISDNFVTLKTGAKGVAVQRIQAKLNQIGFNAGLADGVFGGQTETALKQFQKAVGLTVDGIYGPNTAHALQYYEKPVKESVVGKRVYSKIDNLRVYRAASWEDKFVYASVNKGDSFIIISEHVVGDGKQYRVKNHRGQILYVTAHSKYVEIK